MPEIETVMDLAAMQAEVFEVNTANGWFTEDRHFEEGIALIHSEIAEMLEAYRDHGLEDVTHRCTDPSCGHDPMFAPRPKPEGVGSEAADILIRLLDEAHRQGLEIRQFSEKNHVSAGLTFGQRLARLHMYVAQWHWNVIRLETQEDVTAASMKRTSEWHLAKSYNYLLSVCEEFGIDLHAEYTRKIAYNRTRGHRHGGKRL